ncbi:hypothetical protein BUE80_DR006607 [Diplocarpon rosae]|nr:hypothetical protein BUE80_DR006607 [Diplocarpon rosae]
MNSTKISEILNFCARLPLIVTVSLVHALLNSPTTVERDMVQLVKGGAMRKVVVGGRGGMGEALIMVRDLEDMIQKSGMDEGIGERFVEILGESPMALKECHFNESWRRKMFYMEAAPGYDFISEEKGFTPPGT